MQTSKVKRTVKSTCSHGKEGALLNSAIDKLKANKLKVTEVRKLVLSYLTHSHGPFTIEEIHAGIRIKNCDLVTVYRTLDTLESVGLVRKYEIGDRIARFEFHCAEHPHHHLICKSCKKVEVVEADILHDIKKIALKKGFASLNASVDLFGTCTKCSP